jgi:hypothetical protein
VVVIDAIKFPFKFPNLRAISVHLLAGARPIFVELVNDQGRVTIYHEALDVELDCDVETMEICFIFDGVVGGQKMNLDYIAALVLGGSNKYLSPSMLRMPLKYMLSSAAHLMMCPLASLLRRMSPSRNSETTVIL